jgi:hypothetical protein
MTVVLNEFALAALLESEQGPVGRDLRRRAERVTQLAREKVGFIMIRSTIDVSADVDFRIEGGPQAVIGIKDTGSISRYLAEKETRELVWLKPSLQQGFSE